MQKDVKQSRLPEQLGLNVNNRQISDESQQTLNVFSHETHISVDREIRLLALLVVIIYIATFVLLTLAALITQNLFLFSSIPMMAHALTCMFRRAVDILLPRNPIPDTSKTSVTSLK